MACSDDKCCGVTDAKPVADLREAARDALIDATADVEPRSWQSSSNAVEACRAAIDALADRAEAAEKQAFGEHTLAQEWQGRAEAAERDLIATRSREELWHQAAIEARERIREAQRRLG